MTQTLYAPHSRRTPDPWDMTIAGTGVMLKPQEGGLLIGRKVQSLANVAPTEYSYASEDVYGERTFAFRRLTLGFGERMQTSGVPRRYRYALNAQFAGNLRGKGPKANRITPALTGEVRDFPEALHGGVLTQFILAGRYCLRRSDDTDAGQVSSKDFGAGRQAQAGVRWKHAGATPVDGLFVSLDNKELWRYDGAAWLQMGTSATIPAQFLAVTKDELWRGYDNMVSKVTADPTVAGNWAAAIAVGDSSSVITSLVAIGAKLFVFKDNGRVYSLNTDGSVNDLFGGMEVTQASTNGLNASEWLDYAWFRQGGSFWQVSGAGALTEIGPERMAENDSEVTGPVTCFAGYGGWYGFMGQYNANNGASYLLQYGDWLPPDESQTSVFNFAQVINGALVKWAGQRITALKVSTLVAGNPRLYCGFASGLYDYIKLPVGSPNPFATGSGCEFTASDGEVYWPTHTALFQADPKAFRGFSVFGPQLDANNYVQMSYKDPSVGAYTAVGTNFIANGQRIDLTENTSGKALDVKEMFVSANSSTPVVEGVALHEAVRPSLVLIYDLVVRAHAYLALRDGSIDRQTPEQIRDAMKAAASADGSVTCVLSDEGTRALSFVDYAELLAPDRARWGLSWDLPMKAIEFKTYTVYGTYERESAYTYEQLASSFTYEQLPTI